MLKQFISGSSGLRSTGLGRAGFSAATTGLKATHIPSTPDRKFVVVLENTDSPTGIGQLTITPDVTGGEIDIALYFNTRNGVALEFDFGEQVQVSVTGTTNTDFYYTLYEFEADN